MTPRLALAASSLARVLLLVGLSGLAPASAEEIVTTEDGVAHRPMTVQALDDGKPVRGLALQGTWWPDADDASLSRVGTTDAQGQLEWEPGRSGIVALEGEGIGSLLRVHPAAPPIASWVLLALLCLVPLGGLVLFLRPVARWWPSPPRPDGRPRPPGGRRTVAPSRAKETP